jgi:hypothetical protein
MAASVSVTARVSCPPCSRIVGRTWTLGAAPGGDVGLLGGGDDKPPPPAPPMDPAALDATGAPLPFSTFPYERVTSSRSRSTYFAATPFGYRSKSAWISSTVHLRFLSSAITRWKSPERDLSAFAPTPRLTPPSRMSCRSSVGRLASFGAAAPLWRALALGAPGAGVWAANAALSSSGPHRRPECSTMRVGSTERRPRARLAFDGKFGVPGTR